MMVTEPTAPVEHVALPGLLATMATVAVRRQTMLTSLRASSMQRRCTPELVLTADQAPAVRAVFLVGMRRAAPPV